MNNQAAVQSRPFHRTETIVEKGSVELFTTRSPLLLESGQHLAPVTVAYETYGTLNVEGTNAILVCHALTGSAHAASAGTCDDAGWWDGLIGTGKALDTERYFVICPNILGSCYGTTGPSDIDPATGRPYRAAFPPITVRDMVRVQHALIGHLGVHRVAAVIGGSLGGMQAIEWTLMYPDSVGAVIPIATSVRHSAWCIGWGEIERLAILNDPAWLEGNYDEQPYNGLALARMIAMLSYRSWNSYEDRFAHRTRNLPASPIPYYASASTDSVFEMQSYLHHQGKKLVERFDAATYVCLTRAMDSHDVTRRRGTLRMVLGTIRARTLCIGIDSDLLYPVEEQKQIAAAIPGARYAEITSAHGHDAFLMEYDQLNRIVKDFLA